MSQFLKLEEEQINVLLENIQKIIDWIWGPDLQKCRKILTGGYWHSFSALKPGLTFDPPDTVKKLTIILENFTRSDSLYQYLETAYVRLFVSHREGIAAPLYESCYVDAESGATAMLMGEPALKMKQRFASKGLAVDTNFNEPPDHLAIELEYLYFLLSKGLEGRDGELMVEAGSFAVETMLPWVSKLQQQIAYQMPDHAYTLLISILTAVLDRVGQFDPSQNSRAM